MNFLYPLFLLGALAAALPVVLHFLRRDAAREVPFSAVRLLRQSPIARSRRRRLRDLLLLAARVTALVLLAAAFARPYLADAQPGSALWIVAIDRSFSMGAPGRFARALDLARSAVDEAGPGRVALVAFDDRADVVAGPGASAQARRALAGLRPGFGGTRYAPLFAKAAEIAEGNAARLVIVSDLQRGEGENDQRASLPSNVELDVRDAGPLPSNLAVTRVRVETDRIVASIRNTGSQARSGQLRLERDGRDAGSIRYQVPGQSSVDVSMPGRAPRSGSIAASIDDPGGFPADNVRYAVLDRAHPDAVLVVTSDRRDSGFFVSRALEAAADDTAGTLDVQLVSGANVAAAGLSKYSAVVLLSTRGVERRTRESITAFVRAGGGLLIAASPDVEPAVLSSAFDWHPSFEAAEHASAGATLSPTDLRHPIFRPFGALAANLGQVRFDRAWRLRPDGWELVARFTDGAPALLERREGSGRVLAFASDLDRRWNDFPVHPAFVPFIVEAVRYLSGVNDDGRDYVVSRVPGGADPRPGIQRVQRDGRLVAVNVDPRESAAAAMRPAELEGMVDRVRADGSSLALRAEQAEGRQSYWQYGLLLMLAALVTESFIGRV